jgi:NMD protein affecting ribosome stability and mRNA decay
MFYDMQKRPPLRCDGYMAWVRTLNCVACGRTPTSDTLNDAHHCIADRYSSAKASDFDVMPLCRTCHTLLHQDWPQWEEHHGAQWRFVSGIHNEALRLEILTFNKDKARRYT